MLVVEPASNARRRFQLHHQSTSRSRQLNLVVGTGAEATVGRTVSANCTDWTYSTTAPDKAYGNKPPSSAIRANETLLFEIALLAVQ